MSDITDRMMSALDDAIDEWPESHDTHAALSELKRALLAAPVPPAAPVVPKLSVHYGPMPESNGKSNFTAILCRDGDIYEGFTLARSEYPERVRYDADCVRFLIGEIAERPSLLNYDADKHSGYCAPVVPDEVAKDAARYRFLRDSQHWPAVFDNSDEAEPLRGRHLDDVLGSAIAKQKESSNG
jgi:hypothetical protein